MASALFGIHLPSCGIIGWIFGEIGFITALTELSYAFGRDMAARESGQILTEVHGGWLTYICARFMFGGR